MKFHGIKIAAGLLASTLIVGCATTDFGFPIERGSVDDGQQAFIDHQCHQCHSVSGVRLPPLAGASAPILELGGDPLAARTFAGLVTSVINPNHVISERYRVQLRLNAQVPLDSPMPMPHIDTMTVRQLIDIVTFLDSRYILVEGYESGF